MTDARLETALSRIAPHVDARPAWDDIVLRAGTAPRAGRRLAAVAVAMLIAAGIVAGALAEGVLNGSLDRLSAWVGEQPGQPAPDQQDAFEQQNSASFAHFPNGTRVGSLLRFELEGRAHELLGFRDGTNLCLRVVPALFESTTAVPECVPQELLAHVGEPVAVVSGYVRISDPSRTVLYGFAADAVDSIEVLEDGSPLGEATVDNNAFALVARDGPRPDEPQDPDIVLRARGSDGVTDVAAAALFPPHWAHVDEIPGPTRVEHAIDSGSVGWLERGEARGEPFTWPFDSPDRVLFSRVLAPDPTSSFRLGVAYGEDPDWRDNGRWYCLAWYWPLAPDSWNRGCGRVDLIRSGLSYLAASPSLAGFPHYVGLAADQVTRLVVYYADGSTQRVPLTDNSFSFFVDASQHSKLVAYDDEGRVVRIDVLR